MVLPRMVDRVFRDFYRQICVADFDLARQARHAGQSPRAVEQILLVFTHFACRIEAFADDDVAGGAGERLVAGVLNTDVGVDHRRA